MDFARKQLEKYGWKEGKGLGKYENGIKTALKPKIKLDSAGIGHDSAQQFTYHWWENVYNEAADNIKVKKSGDSIKVESNEKSVNITTRKYIKPKLKNGTQMEYGIFLKKSKLTKEGVICLESGDESDEDDTVKNVKKLNSGINSLTDEELLVACGGRTAHKGARHGLKLSGKLARIEQQERELLSTIHQRKCQIENNGQMETKQVNSNDSLDKELIRATNFLNNIEVKPIKKHCRKPKCIHCRHRRCRCNVFDEAPLEVAELKKNKRKLVEDDTFKSNLLINRKAESTRMPSTNIDQSPQAENAQNKRRKMGVSLDEQIVVEHKTKLKCKRKKRKKMNRKINRLSDNLNKMNFDED